MILLDVTLEARPGHEAAFIALLRRTMAASQAEPGCVAYRFARDLDRAGCFHLVELWQDEAAFDGHLHGSAFRTFLAELPALGSLAHSVARQGDLAPFTYRRPAP